MYIVIVILTFILLVWVFLFRCKYKDDAFSGNNNGLNKLSPRNLIQRFIISNKIDFFVSMADNNYKINIPSYEDFNFKNKGIVISANGNKYRYLTGVYCNIYVIRKLYKSNIPIEIFYVGKSEEFNPKVKKLLYDLGNIKIINLLEKINTNVTENELRGYQTKPLACLCSSFQEIILFDADSLCFVDPYILYSLDGYMSNGMILFLDYVDCLTFVSKDFIESLGIGNYCLKTRSYEIDSSCVVMDKQKAWDALFTICFINVKSDAYYKNTKNVLGDKDTWLIGSMFAKFDPFISMSNPSILISDENKQILGHLQRATFNSVPQIIYYNNQMIDLSSANVNEYWTYKEVKNPKKHIQTYPGDPVPLNVIESFNYAKLAMKNLLPNLPENLRSVVKSTNGISKNFIP
jgi:hypothetical protein